MCSCVVLGLLLMSDKTRCVQMTICNSYVCVLQDDQLLDDSKTLGDCGFTSQTARPQAPATVGLAFRISGMSHFSTAITILCVWIKNMGA